MSDHTPLLLLLLLLRMTMLMMTMATDAAAAAIQENMVVEAALPLGLLSSLPTKHSPLFAPLFRLKNICFVHISSKHTH
jgi:hypothetical protein